MTTFTKTMDTRVMDRFAMAAYLEELTREQHEGIRYQFTMMGRPAPSEELIVLIARAEGMGYAYRVEADQFVMEKPEEHDFLFWNIPVVGTVASETGVVTFAGEG